ncbi:Receptor like protein 27 [Theobroma cacao]|uniref:Receptor like protein 27 n=1 Tax=Theobroma cacao TaxID=3641 RepID=A0A061F9Y2_THECC|nr:Receptor like protein 27 [Theobroma cacao]
MWLSGYIKQFQHISLEEIFLQNNKLQGLDPSSMSQLVNLTSLDLSSNNLSGIEESDLFSKVQNLQNLDLSNNNLYFNSNHASADYTLPNLQSLYMSSCNVNQFPQFLRGSKVLRYLDLSNNRIHDKIPKWMWDVGKDSLEYLNLSHNSMTEAGQLPWKNIIILDLSSNLIQGDLPIPPLTTSTFLISNNNLNGEMSDLKCNVSSLEILDISHNHLSEIIPQCFGKLSKSLRMLNLGTNKLHGTIPSTFAKGCQLENLNLNANQLEGPLTRSILNCRSLQVLDLGNNKINATFPHWLGTLQELKVLVMKSNQMHGSINGKRRTHYFRKLQILDLSNNSFTGRLPTGYIESFKAMMNVEENRNVMPYLGSSDVTMGSFYSYSVHLIEKGHEVELMKIFTTLTIIDLSNNKFEGEIPRVIGKLSSIIGLNLSHNYLVGHIPPSFGNLINLEWLDLSSNKLDGKIPEQLLNLTMLSSLNLSKNELVGHIPEGKQFNTFENSSYEGNDGLCGFPLSRDCSSNEAQQPPPSNLQEEDGSKSEIRFGWKVVLIGYMSGFMFGVGMGYAVFRTGKPKWIVSLVEAKHHRRPKKSNRNACTSRTRKFLSFVWPLPESADYLHKEHEHLTVISINAGCINGAVELDGVVYSEDDCYVGGDVIRTDTMVGDGVGNSLYNTAQFGDFSYEFSSLERGFYNIDLHFAEIVFTSGPPGIRVFDVFIQQEKVVSGLDIYGLVGANKPLVISNINTFFDSGGGLLIRFEGLMRSPIVCGITVRKGSPASFKEAESQEVMGIAELRDHESLRIMKMEHIKLSEEVSMSNNCFKDINEIGSSILSRSKETFKFDAVFGPQADQADAFQDIAPFATSVLDGYNVCILLMDRQGQEKLLQWRVQKKPVE